MNPILSIVLVVFFLFMNAFFVIAEFSLVKVRRSQIEMQVSKNAIGAKQAKRVSDNVNAYLSACQLGITLASLALGWLGEPAVSALIRPLLVELGLSAAAISAIAVAVGFIIITALHIIVGELIPKSMAIFNTERYALVTAPVLVVFYYMTWPVMWLFNSITNGVMKLTGHNTSEEHDAYTDEEIKILVDESYKSGLIEESQYQYMDNLFDLEETQVGDIMTPRIDMVCLYTDDTPEEKMAVIAENMYTRYPLCEEDKDNVIAFVHIKDLLLMDKGETSLPTRPIEVVPDSMPVPKLLKVFQKKKTKIAIVVDEHGGTAGLVTLSDIMDDLLGPIDDEYEHEDDEIQVLDDHHLICDGGVALDDFIKVSVINIDEEEEDSDDYTTLSGLIYGLMDRIPDEGDKISVSNWEFTILEMDAHRIVKIEAEELPPQQEEDSEAEKKED